MIQCLIVIRRVSRPWDNGLLERRSAPRERRVIVPAEPGQDNGRAVLGRPFLRLGAYSSKRSAPPDALRGASEASGA